MKKKPDPYMAEHLIILGGLLLIIFPVAGIPILIYGIYKYNKKTTKVKK